MTVLETSRAGLWLRHLQAGDAAAYHALVQANTKHLTQHGDYQEEVAASAEAVAAELAEEDGATGRFGVFLGDRLIGRVDLIPVHPPRYGLGYWLGADATGQGLAGESVRVVLEHARVVLSATDVFAGVTHGNKPSEALLTRLGFTAVADMGRYQRFHRSLSGGDPDEGADQG